MFTFFLTFPETSLNDQELERFWMVSQGSADKGYVCKLCGKHGKRLFDIKRHVKIHTGLKPFSCPICKKHFREKHHVDRHMILHMGQPLW